MIYRNLFERIGEPQVVRAGLIGAGDFGTPIVTQAKIIPRLDVPVVADIDLDAARRALYQAYYRVYRDLYPHTREDVHALARLGTAGGE